MKRLDQYLFCKPGGANPAPPPELKVNDKNKMLYYFGGKNDPVFFHRRPGVRRP